ncbi:PREDICTED: tetraspanin-6-like [Thamnophis sirtalis]|uniref:Tetraspanin-6-like n=1 Tax=Thamnophis sirtalis TaxID=35019 RepID=A0A6I9YJD7_9SAUR|nr:PREDICTED: tetraspanin-6-like [Thamnophis sirtalis]
MASPSRRLQTKPVITCLKSVLLIYTFVFWFTGIVLLGVGIWAKVSLEVYFFLLNEKASNVPYVLIGAGLVVALLGTFGCFATCRGSTWMLKLYAMFLTLIFLVVLVAAILGFVFRHEVRAVSSIILRFTGVKMELPVIVFLRKFAVGSSFVFLEDRSFPNTKDS